ncbi:hypothetical protein ILYODFUR_034388 [Ilyodon furcidens]|uniref:Uncharacterized protein n=1 Tax=Ilyodon furcidens TaxID=33524 RepID=A0ABV0TP78_9TELE
MDQCEDREEGVPPSETTLCGEHESQSIGQRNHQTLKPEPDLSCVSIKSDLSKDLPLKFKPAQPSVTERIHQRLKPEPEPSSLSFKSDLSKDLPLKFKLTGSPSSERTIAVKWEEWMLLEASWRLLHHVEQL